MNRGFSAASPSAARSFLIAVFSPSSNSTKVSLGHSRCRISSRPTSSPGDSRSISSTRKGCSCNLTRSPPLVRTRRPKSASNSPKHAALGLGEVRSISIYLRKTSADCSTTVQNRLQPPLFSLSYLYRSSPEIDPLTQRPVLAISHSSRNSRSDLEAPCLLAPSLRSRLALEPHLCFSLPLPAFSPAVAAVHRALPRAAPSQPSPPSPCPQLLPPLPSAPRSSSPQPRKTAAATPSAALPSLGPATPPASPPSTAAAWPQASPRARLKSPLRPVASPVPRTLSPLPLPSLHPSRFRHPRPPLPSAPRNSSPPPPRTAPATPSAVSPSLGPATTPASPPSTATASPPLFSRARRRSPLPQPTSLAVRRPSPLRPPPPYPPSPSPCPAP